MQPVLTYTNKENIKVRSEFYENRLTTNDYLRKQNSYDIFALHFDFAVNYFVVDIPMNDFKNSAIHLEDENGNIVGEKYAVKQGDKFDLHKNYGNTWYQFNEKFTPKPKNVFQHLITLKANHIEVVKGILFEKISYKLTQKYNYKNRIIFNNQIDLEEVFKLVQPKFKNIDFSKKVVFYQLFGGDCRMKVNLFKVTNKNSITIKSYRYYGRCRASGRKEFLSIIDKPKNETKLLFKNLDYQDFNFLNYF